LDILTTRIEFRILSMKTSFALSDSKVILPVLVMLFHTLLNAATVTSTADNAGPTTLRTLINLAMPGDTINFALPPGSTITMTLGKIVIDKNLTISGPGPTNLTIVGANPNERVFEIQPNMGVGVTVNMSRLRFSGGYKALDGAPGTLPSPNGQNGGLARGGIVLNNMHCTLNVSNCIMDGCFALGGNGGRGFGGIVAPPGNGGFGGQSQGGAIFTAGICAVYDSTFQSNLAVGGNGGNGTNAASSYNGSDGGGGGAGSGGAIYVDYTGDSPALVTVNCTFFDNLAHGGDGGRGGDGKMAAQAGDGGDGGNAAGGALYHAALGCSLGDCGNMVHCTLNQNHLLPGIGGAGGIGTVNGSPGAGGSGSGGGILLLPIQFQIGNSIVAANSCIAAAPCLGPDVNGTVVSLGFNFISAVDASSTGWTVAQPGLDYRGTVLIPLDAKLGPLQNNGGETPTMTLLDGSLAIDAGGPTLFTLDQIGQTRPIIVKGIANGGDGSDIGAYELQCSVYKPSLSIAHSSTNLSVAWLWPSRCYVLQQTSDLGSPNWVDAPYPVNVVGPRNIVNISPPPENLFFRLKK
jgi:hypothetical protein